VDRAGATMSEVLASIARLAQIMTGIAQASEEQARGLTQVEQAVLQLDQTTQQNAAMVEQLTAAASNLKSLSAQLVETVSIFKIAGGGEVEGEAWGTRRSAEAPASRFEAEIVGPQGGRLPRLSRAQPVLFRREP
jgi:methyl-accepting chemotaxis protein